MNYAGCLRKMDVPTFVEKYPPAAQNAQHAGGTPAQPKKASKKANAKSTKRKAPPGGKTTKQAKLEWMYTIIIGTISVQSRYNHVRL